MDSMRHQHTQFPQATAPGEQYWSEEQLELPNYELPSIKEMQQMVQPSAPVSSWDPYHQGEQYALWQAAPNAWNAEQMVQSTASVPIWDFISPAEQYALLQAAPSAWDIQQVVQPTAPVPYGNYNHQGGEQYAPYTPPQADLGVWSPASTSGMMARTPGTISPAGIPSAAAATTYGYGMIPQMQAPQAHLPQQQHHQQQQRLAADADGHVCRTFSADMEDQSALVSMCQYSRRKGRHGESCADVGDSAMEKAIGEYRSGSHAHASQAFQRLASKNLNQKRNRAEKARIRAAAARRSP